MSATRNPGPNAADDDDLPEEPARIMPDEDGPHDVPDDMVIERTLPSTPRSDSDAGGPG
jgi:hypothetical protein